MHNIFLAFRTDFTFFFCRGDRAKLYEGFSSVEEKSVPNFSSLIGGNTNVSPAIRMALDLLAKQKEFYKNNKISYFQPWLVLFTDGLPTDDVSAIKRELIEELGAEVQVICKLGVVSDYYNLIHRHNINNYFLCRVISFGERHLTEDEIEKYHLSTLKLSYDEAIAEYGRCKSSKLGRLIANRELPILMKAKELVDNL